MADLDITVDENLTNNTAPATTDRLLLVDDGTTSLQDITLANLLKVVNSLTADGTPDISADYLLAYDADAGAAKKVLMNLVGGGTTSINGLELIWNSGTSLSIGVGAAYAENGDYINVTSTLTASSLSLSNSTWYHVYVYLSGGSPAMEVVTTAPVAWKGTAYSKTGDTSRRYMFSVKTNASGSVYRVIHDPTTNIVFYLNDELKQSPFRVLSNGVATTATSVSLSGIVPVTTLLAYGRLANTDASQYVNIGVATLTTTAFDFFLSAAQRIMSFFAVDTGQVIYYMYAISPSNGLSIDVAGYKFKR